MEPFFYFSESKSIPKMIEIQGKTAYIRKNIVERHTPVFDKINEKEGFRVDYVCEEAKMSIPEFNEYVSLISSQNAINGVNDSTNISSILSSQQVNDFNQLAIMEAIVELFEMLTTIQTSSM